MLRTARTAFGSLIRLANSSPILLFFSPGYQYTPQYPPYYKMTPVYSWYQRDSKPTPAVEMEPKSQGKITLSSRVFGLRLPFSSRP